MRLKVIRETPMDTHFWNHHLVSNCFAIMQVETARLQGASWAGIIAIWALSALMPMLGAMHILTCLRALRLVGLPWRKLGKDGRTPGRRLSVPPRSMWVWMPAGLAMAALTIMPENSPIERARTGLEGLAIGGAAAGTVCWAITTRAALADTLQRWREKGRKWARGGPGP